MQTLTLPIDTLCLGIDIGRNGFHLSIANRDQSPKKWQVIKFEYDNPDWWRGLVAVINDQPAIVVAEPTGWHYLAPVAHLLQTLCPSSHLYLINHDASRRIRQAYLSRSNKTDEIDSRALAFVALDIASGREPAGIRSNSVRAAQAVMELRMHVNERARLTKLETRSLNRIEHWCFSIWPALANRKATYIRAALMDAVTPDQIRELVGQGHHDPRTIRHIRMMVEELPEFVGCPPVVEQSIRHIINEYRPLPEAIEQAEQRITATLDSPHFIHVVQRWRTMPGITDPLIGALLIACRADVLTMTRDEFRAAVGVAPGRSQSGKSDAGKKSRRGYRPALAGLHLYAILLQSPKQPDNPIRRQHDRRPYLARTKTKLADLLWSVAHSESGYQFPRP